MIRVDGDRVAVEGDITLDALATWLDTPVAWPAVPVTTVDFGAVGAVDSAAIALLLAWQRAARAAGVELRLHGAPPAVASLAALYGVEALLPVAA